MVRISGDALEPARAAAAALGSPITRLKKTLSTAVHGFFISGGLTWRRTLPEAAR
jgi:hypothetical protein